MPNSPLADAPGIRHVVVTLARPLHDRVAGSTEAGRLTAAAIDAELARMLRDLDNPGTVSVRVSADDAAGSPLLHVLADGQPCPFPARAIAEALAYAQASPQAMPDEAAVRGAVLDLNARQCAEVIALVCREAISARLSVLAALSDGEPALKCRTVTLHAQPGYLRALTLAIAGRDAASAAAAAQAGETDQQTFSYVRSALFEELGVALPPIGLRPDPDLHAGAFAIEVSGLRSIPRIGLPSDLVFTNASPADATAAGVEARPTLNPAQRQPGSLAPAADQAALEAAGYVTWEAVGYVALNLAAAIRQHAHALLTRDEAAAMTQRIGSAFPVLIQLASRHVPPEVLAPVLRDLLFSHVSIRRMRRILELMLSHATAGAAGDRLAHVRRGLADAIADKLSRQGNTLLAYILERDAEQAVAEYGRATGLADSRRAQAADRLSAAVRATLSELPSGALVPVILTRDDLRRPLTGLLRPEFPWLTVAGYADVPSTHNVQPVARISVG